MKLVIASDIHGSEKYTELLFERIKDEAPDRIVLLGDLLYHGPRNDLPLGHAPKKVVELLNAHAAQITAVRGNCDCEVDQMVLDFPCMSDTALIVDGAYTLFATHGHNIKPSFPPKLPKKSAFLSGHTHIKCLEENEDGLLLVNPGSVSLPKDTSHSYASYCDGVFSLKLLETGEVLTQKAL